MKRIYVAGPYTCHARCSGIGVSLTSMRKGIKICTELLGMGYSPFCPWLDYLFEFCREEDQKIDWHGYSLDWLRVSDAVLVIGMRENSVGVKGEIEEAKRLEIPVFYSIDDLNYER